MITETPSNPWGNALANALTKVVDTAAQYSIGKQNAQQNSAQQQVTSQTPATPATASPVVKEASQWQITPTLVISAIGLGIAILVAVKSRGGSK